MTEMRSEGARGASPFDSATLAEVRRLRPDALDRFFQHFYDRAYGYVAMLLGDRHAAEDITHDAFLRMHRALHRLDPERDPTPWVFTVLANTVRDHWRSAERRAVGQHAGLEAAREVAATGVDIDPEAVLARLEERREVEAALDELSPAEREIILLRAYEGLATSEIAEVLGTREDAVRQRWSRALRKFSTVHARLTRRNDSDERLRGRYRERTGQGA